MQLINPLALALGLLAIPIILLYMLRLRRNDRLVSSTLLWLQLVKDRTANAPWQKLRWNVLLFLQLLILGALVFALARPFIPAAGRLDGDLIVLLDISASMTTTGGPNGHSRFENAIDQANELIDNLNGNDQMTLITAGQSPLVLAAASGDKGQLRQAVNDLVPESTEADWTGAFSLAAGSVQGKIEPQFVIISDGGLPDILPTLPGDVTYIPVGNGGENLALTALGSRSSAGQEELLVTVENFGEESGEALVTLRADGELFDSRRATIAPGEKLNFTWDLPGNSEIIEALVEPLDSTIDSLAVDNQAWYVIDNQMARRVWLIGEGNLFLERLFAILPGFEVIRSESYDPENVAEGDRAADLVIFDGVLLPDELPAANILILDPQPSDSGSEASPSISVTGTFTNTALVGQTNDPLLADVSWDGISISEAATVNAPTLQSLVDTQGGSMFLAGEIDGRRVAILPFDLADSDLPLQIAFPIIMANIIDWLNPGRINVTSGNIQTGEIVSLVSDPRAELLTIELPNGEQWTHELQSSSEAILFPETDQVGIYSVAFQDSNGDTIRTGQFAVNFLLPEESRIGASIDRSAFQRGQAANATQILGRGEIWPFFLGAGFLVMMAEWWFTYRRGMKRPPLKTRP